MQSLNKGRFFFRSAEYSRSFKYVLCMNGDYYEVYNRPGSMINFREKLPHSEIMLHHGINANLNTTFDKLYSATGFIKLELILEPNPYSIIR
jgi:hypothetical protein